VSKNGPETWKVLFHSAILMRLASTGPDQTGRERFEDVDPTDGEDLCHASRYVSNGTDLPQQRTGHSFISAPVPES
jgi:hypothetical protein